MAVASQCLLIVCLVGARLKNSVTDNWYLWSETDLFALTDSSWRRYSAASSQDMRAAALDTFFNCAPGCPSTSLTVCGPTVVDMIEQHASITPYVAVMRVCAASYTMDTNLERLVPTERQCLISSCACAFFIFSPQLRMSAQNRALSSSCACSSSSDAVKTGGASTCDRLSSSAARFGCALSQMLTSAYRAQIASAACTGSTARRRARPRAPRTCRWRRRGSRRRRATLARQRRWRLPLRVRPVHA